VGIFLLTVGVGLYVWAILRTWKGRRDPWAIWMGFGVLAAVFVVGTHAFGEFFLRTPANALTLSALMAWGWVLLHLHNRGSRKTEWSGSVGEISLSPWAARGGVVLLAGAHLALGFGMAKHLLAEARVPTERNSTVVREDVLDIRALRDAIDLEPGNAARWAWLAREVTRHGEREEVVSWAREKGLSPMAGGTESGPWAAAFLGRAIRLNPTDPSLYQQLGWTLAAEPHWRQEGLAERILRAAVTLEPANGSRHFHLGHYLLLDGRRAEARVAFQEALRLSPGLGGGVEKEWEMFDLNRKSSP
jgi:hypothetical protein